MKYSFKSKKEEKKDTTFVDHVNNTIGIPCGQGWNRWGCGRLEWG
jgi:hypothetical protein